MTTKGFFLVALIVLVLHILQKWLFEYELPFIY